MASEAELKAVFDIFKNDEALATEAARALEWAARRAGVELTDAEQALFSFALLVSDPPPEGSEEVFLSIQCASKGCTAGGG